MRQLLSSLCLGHCMRISTPDHATGPMRCKSLQKSYLLIESSGADLTCESQKPFIQLCANALCKSFPGLDSDGSVYDLDAMLLTRRRLTLVAARVLMLSCTKAGPDRVLSPAQAQCSIR